MRASGRRTKKIKWEKKKIHKRLRRQTVTIFPLTPGVRHIFRILSPSTEYEARTVRTVTKSCHQHGSCPC